MKIHLHMWISKRVLSSIIAHLSMDEAVRMVIWCSSTDSCLSVCRKKQCPRGESPQQPTVRGTFSCCDTKCCSVSTPADCCCCIWFVEKWLWSSLVIKVGGFLCTSNKMLERSYWFILQVLAWFRNELFIPALSFCFSACLLHWPYWPDIAIDQLFQWLHPPPNWLAILELMLLSMSFMTASSVISVFQGQRVDGQNL